MLGKEYMFEADISTTCYCMQRLGGLMGGEPVFIHKNHECEKNPALTMFSDLAESLRESSSEDEMANSFLPKLVNLPGIVATAIYVKTKSENNFALTAQCGFPSESLPRTRKLDQSLADDDEGLIHSPVWDLLEDDSINIKVRFFTTSVLKANEHINGLLIIGWDSQSAISPDVKDAISAAATMLGSAIESARLYSELEKAHVDSIAIINKLISVVDEFGKGHSTRVAKIAEAIAAEMGLKNEQLTLIYEAGIVHDVGRICIPPEILNKPGKLTVEEYAIVKQHPRVGAGLIAPLNIYKNLVPGVLYHHERLDGSGYPEGLIDAQIPLIARILAVADVYDAMTCDRAYRSAHGTEYAIITLVEGSGTKFDPDVVDAFARAVKKAHF